MFDATSSFKSASSGVWGFSFYNIEIDVSNETAIRYEIEHNITAHSNGAHVGTWVKQLDFITETNECICPYADVESLGQSPAYGGSNYISPYITNLSNKAGYNNGDGYIRLRSINQLGPIVSKTFESSTDWTVPYTGIYQISCFGEKGEDYDDKVGGNGGYVSGNVYLTTGEVDEYGGIGNIYGDGGGLSSVYLNRIDATPFLIAGGGGGATNIENGCAGGLSDNLLTSSSGGNGEAGGGAGYFGGNAGEVIAHNHTNDCYLIEDIGRNVITLNNAHGEYVSDSFITASNQVYSNGYAAEGTFTVSKGSYISTNNCPKMIITIKGGGWGDYYFGDTIKMNFRIYNQDEEIIFSMNSDELISDDTIPTSHGIFEATNTGKHFNPTHEAEGTGTWGISFYEIEVDVSNATGIRYEIEHYLRTDTSNDYGNWVYTFIQKMDFVGEKKELVCEFADKDDNYTIATNKAYGGSNYISNNIKKINDKNGINNGEAKVFINSIFVGGYETNKIEGVSAPDKKAPVNVKVSKVGDINNQIKYKWSAEDIGTNYSFKV